MTINNNYMYIINATELNSCQCIIIYLLMEIQPGTDLRKPLITVKIQKASIWSVKICLN